MLADIELEFESPQVHLEHIETSPQVVEMLYRDRVLGRHWIGVRALARYKAGPAYAGATHMR